MPAQNPYSVSGYSSYLVAGAKFTHANRWKRLVARIIDGLFLYLIVLSGIFMSNTAILFGMALSIFLQLFLLYTKWQTIGKMLMRVKIANENGDPARFGQIIFREIITIILNVFPLFSLIDSLLIFRETQQCGHDQVAKTQVIEA